MSMMEVSPAGGFASAERVIVARPVPPIRTRSKRRRLPRRAYARFLRSIEAMQVEQVEPAALHSTTDHEEWPNTMLIDDLAYCEDPRESVTADF